jgi:hypothetical protein
MEEVEEVHIHSRVEEQDRLDSFSGVGVDFSSILVRGGDTIDIDIEISYSLMIPDIVYRYCIYWYLPSVYTKGTGLTYLKGYTRVCDHADHEQSNESRILNVLMSWICRDLSEILQVPA